MTSSQFNFSDGALAPLELISDFFLHTSAFFKAPCYKRVPFFFHQALQVSYRDPHRGPVDLSLPGDRSHRRQPQDGVHLRSRLHHWRRTHLHPIRQVQDQNAIHG